MEVFCCKLFARAWAVAILAGFFSLRLSAQAPPVSTLPQNKNAVLEIYDGIYCSYCPQGHQIAGEILNNTPNDVVLISIHSGQYAAPAMGDPDFRTEYGAALAGQTGLNGYPAGTVNRHVFPGLQQGVPGNTAMNRAHWQNAVNQTLAEPSPVNIAAEATIDVAAGLLTVNLEFYYTASSSAPTNFLHVALVQNHIAGSQIGGATGDFYDHNHVLRHLVTGQWGQAIGTTTAGYFEGRQYTYALPADIRDIPLEMANLRLAVFISEGHQEIINGISVTPDFIMPHDINAGLLYAKSDPVICNSEVAPALRIRNEGNAILNSLQVNYQVNNGSMQQYAWYGSLETYEWVEVTLPSVAFMPAAAGTNLIRIFSASPNGTTDQWAENDSTEVAFSNPPVCNTMTLKVELKTDAFGYETYWELIDDQGVVYDHGGNENVGANGGGTQYATPSDPGAYGNHQFISKYITVPVEGCYYLRLLDDYGDGICCDYGDGYYRIKNAQGNLLVSGGLFTVEYREPVYVQEIAVAVVDVSELSLDAKIYPNPVQGDVLYCRVELPAARQIAVSIFDISGRMMGQPAVYDLPAGASEISLSTTNLAEGAYQLRLTTDSGHLGKVFVVHR